MARFRALLAPAPGMRVIDLAGTAACRQDWPVPLDNTVLNPPESTPPGLPPSHHRVRLLAGDACVTGLPDGAFGIAFSNRVIEHAGEAARRAAFAAAARRLAPLCRVQTPAIWLPLEAHTHMPFWFLWPEAARAAMIRRWRVTLPAWCAMVEGTTVLRRGEMLRLFPDGRLWTERFAGIAKSYVMWRG
jgi:hypothetical protein